MTETVTKAHYDEVLEALQKENKTVQELAEASRLANVKLGHQIRDLQAALRAATRLIDMTPNYDDGHPELEAAKLTWQHHKPLVDSIKPKTKEPSP